MSEKHGNTGNNNAKKAPSEKADSHMHFRCKKDDKALIVRNLKDGETLASFMLSLGVAEAMRRQNENMVNGCKRNLS
ncbi:hypothetical protein HUZ36_04705 [Pseudoalteromonas sp. McH1-7]|uniref:hypothetical protein n=1 Tax=Pseudoalteromonas sp. McH1-7 TaxID=2745574 RepID=UPI001590FBAA|nr:hypothetical protein [Pseudoalteromonas sp. McH1-7]NUZ10073.1 hypothetical protein [Pseudoalteromonas sp. McH1-7]